MKIERVLQSGVCVVRAAGGGAGEAVVLSASYGAAAAGEIPAKGKGKGHGKEAMKHLSEEQLLDLKRQAALLDGIESAKTDAVGRSAGGGDGVSMFRQYMEQIEELVVLKKSVADLRREGHFGFVRSGGGFCSRLLTTGVFVVLSRIISE